MALRATSESESGCVVVVVVGEKSSIRPAMLDKSLDGASRGERRAGLGTSGVGISGVGRSTIVTVRCGPVALSGSGLGTTGGGSLSSSMVSVLESMGLGDSV